MARRKTGGLVALAAAVAAVTVLLARPPGPGEPYGTPPSIASTAPPAPAWVPHDSVRHLTEHPDAEAAQHPEQGAATADLASALSGAGPVQPAPEVVGAGTVVSGTPAWVRVGVPTARGDLLLDLVIVGDAWRVCAVDWQRW